MSLARLIIVHGVDMHEVRVRQGQTIVPRHDVSFYKQFGMALSMLLYSAWYLNGVQSPLQRAEMRLCLRLNRQLETTVVRAMTCWLSGVAQAKE